MRVIRFLSTARVIARGRGIRELARLKKRYPAGRNWRKKSAKAEVELLDGILAHAEVHWYEAHGCGQMEHKIKRLLD